LRYTARTSPWARGAHETGPEEQVLGWVAGDGELREQDEVGALAARAPEPLDDARRVAVDVADDAIDLGQCESHPTFSPLGRKPLVRET
jgi:hypothetical protein